MSSRGPEFMVAGVLRREWGFPRSRGEPRTFDRVWVDLFTKQRAQYPLLYCQRMVRTDSAACVTPLGAKPDQLSSTVSALVPDFAHVYRRYFEFVWCCTRRLGVSEAELDDVVQEIFIVIHGRLRTLEHPESLRSWIYGITRRTVSTYRRARRAKDASVAALYSESEMHYPERPSPQALAEQSDQAKLLWKLLDRLDPPKREVFVLAELDEMTVPEIASALNVPVNTAYSRLRVARQELEDGLARHVARTSLRGRSCPT
jgi:RNA polymerase sigma-70 factor, ECF subfamily